MGTLLWLGLGMTVVMLVGWLDLVVVERIRQYGEDK